MLPALLLACLASGSTEKFPVFDQPVEISLELANFKAEEGGQDRARPALRVERQEAFPGDARFLVADSGFLDPCGFAYSVLGEPLRLGEDQYLPLLGKWYR